MNPLTSKRRPHEVSFASFYLPQDHSAHAPITTVITISPQEDAPAAAAPLEFPPEPVPLPLLPLPLPPLPVVPFADRSTKLELTPPDVTTYLLCSTSSAATCCPRPHVSSPVPDGLPFPSLPSLSSLLSEFWFDVSLGLSSIVSQSSGRPSLSESYVPSETLLSPVLVAEAEDVVDVDDGEDDDEFVADASQRPRQPARAVSPVPSATVQRAAAAAALALSAGHTWS